MKHLNKKNTTRTFKANVCLMAMSLILITGNLFCQQSSFAKRQNMPDAVSKILGKRSFEKMNSVANKNKIDLGDTTECLEIKGKFDGSVKDFNGIYTAKLILDNKIVETQILNIRKSFEFTLQKNRLYAVRVEKDGYISKTISIYTYVTDTELNAKNYYAFDFETNLLSQEIQGCFNDDDVDFPVALIGYHKTCDCFDYNKEYTASLITRMVNSLFFGI